MSHLKPKVQQPQTAADYVRTNFEVLAKDIHSLDQIELHKQTGEMIYSTLTDKSMMTISCRILWIILIHSCNLKKPPPRLRIIAVSYTHLRAHETKANLVCRLLLEKKN